MKKSENKDTNIELTHEQAPNHRKDYAEFLDLAVHELDSPLRKLNVLVEKLGEKYESGQQEQGREYLTRAQASLKNIRSLIDSIYTLTLLDTEEMIFETCDTRGIIEELLPDLKSSLQNKSVEIIADNLPEVYGDARQVRRLFREILENAVRFTGEKVEIRVEITGQKISSAESESMHLQKDRNYIKLVVCDNGIGFAKEDAQRIFQPFVRLNGRSEYTGNGIGLAICRKIVDSHHGIIYAESNDREGSSIYIILPQSLN